MGSVLIANQAVCGTGLKCLLQMVPHHLET